MKKFGILLVAIALAMLVSCASAADLFDAKKIDMGGYTVTIPDIVKPNNYQVKTVFDTIEQGETDWVSKVVSGYYTQLCVRLDWGDSSDSLRLKIYSPDGYTFGYYYDTSGGQPDDGLIEVNINNDEGIAEGTWWYEVYGYDVTGTEDYSI